MRNVPMISIRSWGVLPDIIAQQSGRGRLRACLEEADLHESLLGCSERFVPQASMVAFFLAASRRIGEEQFSVEAASQLSVRDYGLWGDYVLSAPSLADSMRRAIRALAFHCSGDDLQVRSNGDEIHFCFRFAHQDIRGYEIVAYASAGILLSLVRSYLGSDWQPSQVHLDVPSARSSSRIEEAIGGPCQFDARQIVVAMPREALAVKHSGLNHSGLGADQTLTIADVARDARGGAPLALPDVTIELVRDQILQRKSPTLDWIARRIGIGPRTLQRQLEYNGLNYRSIVSSARSDRAKELLREPDIAIGHVSRELGYSSPTHFARAFAKVTGVSPRDFRRSAVGIHGKK